MPIFQTIRSKQKRKLVLMAFDPSHTGWPKK